MAERGRDYTVRERNRTAHLVVENLVIAFVDAGVDGRAYMAFANERFKQGRPTMFAASHFSNSDWPIVDHVFRVLGYREFANRTSIVQGSSLEKHSAARWLMSGYKRISIPSSRDEKYKSDRFAYKSGLETGRDVARRELLAGNPVGIFMGKGRGYEGELEFVPSDIARWFQLVPETVVVPISLVDTNKRLKPHSLVPRPGSAGVKFGAPIFVDRLCEGLDGQKNRDDLIVNTIMDEIATNLPERCRGYYAQPGTVRGVSAPSVLEGLPGKSSL